MGWMNGLDWNGSGLNGNGSKLDEFDGLDGWIGMSHASESFDWYM